MGPNILPVAVLGVVALCWAPAAHAGAVEDLVTEARKSLEQGAYADVRRFTKRADKIASNEDGILSTHLLATVWFYQGLAEWNSSAQDEAMDSWRTALMTDVKYEWDTAFPHDEAESVFESLRREIRSREKIDIVAPADTGQAQIYVAGRLAYPGDQVVEGRYLVQASCPDGEVYSKWWKFGKPPDYEALCPDGFGEIASEPVANQDDVALMFDDFGNPILPGDDAVSPDLIEPSLVVEPTTTTSVTPDPATADPATPDAGTSPAGGVDAASTEPSTTGKTKPGKTKPEKTKPEKTKPEKTRSGSDASDEPAIVDQPTAVVAPTAVDEPASVEEPVAAEEPAPVEEPVKVVETAPVKEPVKVVETSPLKEPVAVEEPAPVKEPAKEPASAEALVAPEAQDGVADAGTAPTTDVAAGGSDPGGAAGVESMPTGKEPKPPRDKTNNGESRSAAGKAMLYSGTGFLAIGAGMNFLLVNPAWAEVVAAQEDAAAINRDDADVLTARFNARRWLTLGTLGVGVVGVGSGMLLSSSTLAMGPSGLLWWGSF